MEPRGYLTRSAATTLGVIKQRVLGRLPDVGRRTRRVNDSGGSGGAATPYIITEAGATAAIGVFSRVSGSAGATGAVWNPAGAGSWDIGSGDEVDVSLAFMSGVAFTGHRLFASTAQGRLCWTSGMASHNFDAIAESAIAAGATGPVFLIGSGGGMDSVDAENVMDFQVEADGRCIVHFIDCEQKYVITAGSCPE